MALSAEEYGSQLAARLERINRNLDNIVSKIATTSETSNLFWSKINKEIRLNYEEARAISKNWSNERIPIYYREKMREQFYKLKNRKIRPPAINKIKYSDFVNKDSVKQSLAALLGETNATYATGFLSGQNTMIQLSRLTQQLNLNEKQIERAIADGFIEKGSVNASKKNLQQQLLKKSIDGKYITVINKNGDPMQFQIADYSKLVAQTKLIEASTQAVVDTTTGLGEDLVQVSAHNTQTEYDAQFEGKIFSLSGNDPDFPIAEDLPPFHPRCKHSISTVIKEGLQADGTLDKYIEFSNDEAAEHPTRKGFIPLSEREF